MDTLALSLPAPLILAKIACFTNGCCHGRECHFPWAVSFPEGGIAPPGLSLHPTQLYEIFVLAVLGGTLWALNMPRWRGSLILWFLVIYGLGRPFTEIYRGDLNLRPALGPLSTSQAACLAGATICVGLLLLLRRRLSAEHCGPVSSLDEL